MVRKVAVLLILTVFAVSSVAASDYSADFRLDQGESKTLGGYEFSFISVGSESSFKVGEARDNGTLVLRTVDGWDIKDMRGEVFSPESGFSYKVENVEMAQGFMDIEVNASRDVFASSSIEVSGVPRRILVSQGGEATFNLEIENTGVVNQTFNLGVASTNQVNSTFNNQGFNVTQVYVAAGETKTIETEVQFSKQASLGLTNVTVFAAGESRAEESFKFYVRPREFTEQRRAVDVSLNEQYMRANPGEQISVPFRVRNSGNVPLQNVSINVEVPEGWDKSVDPESIATLQRFRPGVFQVQITPPEDAESGDFFVEMTASTQEIDETSRERLRVNITEKSGLRYVGLGIMVVSLGSLAAVYRKFGRR